MSTSTALWTLFSDFLIGLAYFAALAFVAGPDLAALSATCARRCPARRRDAGPDERRRAALRVAGDVLLFPTLFKADKALWAGAWLFHAALCRDPVAPLALFHLPGARHRRVPLAPVALLGGYIFGLAALYLFWRRLALPRTLYLSGLPDYFALVLLGAIAGTGILVKLLGCTSTWWMSKPSRWAC